MVLVCVVAVLAAIGVAVRHRPGGGRELVVMPPNVVLRSDALAGVNVVIDPGHGGTDPGAVRGGVTEASLNYRMASVLAVVVRQAGGIPWFTITSTSLSTTLVEGEPEPPLTEPIDAVSREAPDIALRSGREDTQSLYRRGDYATRIQRDHGGTTVFIALHHDAADSSAKRGGIVLWESRQLTPPPLVLSLTARFTRLHLVSGRQGRHLGVLAPAHNEVTDRVLMELATISNAADRRGAMDPVWRWRVARQLAAAIAAR